VLNNKLDHSKLVKTMKSAGYVPLILSYLKTIQHENNNLVNEIINEI